MKYRKKPIVVEAFQYLPDSEGNFVRPEWASKDTIIAKHDDSESWLCLLTHHGLIVATSGEWIIKGIKGEIYPCKPDIFESTYERVE